MTTTPNKVTDNVGIVITMPDVVGVPDVEITVGGEYPGPLWDEVARAIDKAEAEVIRLRRTKRLADTAYEAAMAQREAVQEPRDLMIATDCRTPAAVARVAGIGRARCSQIRAALRKTGAVRQAVELWQARKGQADAAMDDAA